MTINFNIPFTKKFYAQKFHTLKFNVCAKIEALYIKFQKKINLTQLAIPLVRILILKNATFLSIFDQMSSFHSGSLLKKVSKIKKESYFEYLLQTSFKISLNFGRRASRVFLNAIGKRVGNEFLMR
jgi:hypothetical protein